MSIPNHAGRFRPLRGGIAVLNPRVNQSGTIGLVATSNGTDRWIVSAYHVLCGDRDDWTDGEPVYQPVDAEEGALVATLARDRARRDLDIAAAKVIAAVPTAGELLGLRPLTPATRPVPNQRVVKSGLATGVTEGVVARMDGAGRVVVEVPKGFPPGYSLAEVGDSGAVWVSRQTGAPVAMHLGSTDAGGVLRSEGIMIATALAALHLKAVIG